MNMEAIFKKVARKVSPNKKELAQEKKLANKLIKKLEKFLPKKARVSFVGSAARDTGLKGDRDIDLFAAFPPDWKESKIVKTTFTAARKAIKTKWITHYAEHPYLQGKIGKSKVEVIPCFQVKPHTGIKSAVDRSPLHMDYLQKKLTQAQRRDVRVLKKLLKTHGIYGAEVETSGFSGLVCEQLMLEFGSLENLLKAAAKWIPPVVIDVEKSWENTSDKNVKKELLDKFGTGLILIDVIDKNRNAAAAVSRKSLAKFMLLAAAFVKKPNISFFKEKKEKLSIAKAQKAAKKRGTILLLVEFKKPNIIEDILYPQLKRTENNMARELQRRGFHLFGSSEHFPKAQLLFELEYSELPRVKKLTGPPAWNDKNVYKFLKGKKPLKGPYLEGEKVCIDVALGERRAERIMREILLSEKTGIASHFIEPAKKARVKIVRKVERKNVEIVSRYCLEREEWV